MSISQRVQYQRILLYNYMLSQFGTGVKFAVGQFKGQVQSSPFNFFIPVPGG